MRFQATTSYTLTFRKGEVIDSWYGGYSSKLYNIQLALVPVPDGNTLAQAYTEKATNFGDRRLGAIL